MTPEQRIALNEVIWVDPGRMSGTPCFRETRVPIQTMIDHWQGGSTIEEFLQDFPTVTRAQAVKFVLTDGVITPGVSQGIRRASAA